jgi:hypothetical protein
VNLDEYRRWTRHASWPNDDQCNRFAWHVMNAHSWYKGSLQRGTRLLVYLDAELGGGFTGGRRVFDRKWCLHGHEYRNHYGRFAYLWGGRASVDWSSDYGVETVNEASPFEVSQKEYSGPELPPEIIEHCSFDLFPFAHRREFILLAHYLHHLDAIREIWAGRGHPHRRLLCILDEADFDGHGPFDHEGEVEPIWAAVAARGWKPPWWPPGLPLHPTSWPLPQLIKELRWASEQDSLTARQQACAHHLWRRYRKIACLEETERLKIVRALGRLHQLIRG